MRFTLFVCSLLVAFALVSCIHGQLERTDAGNTFFQWDRADILNIINAVKHGTAPVKFVEMKDRLLYERISLVAEDSEEKRKLCRDPDATDLIFLKPYLIFARVSGPWAPLDEPDLSSLMIDPQVCSLRWYAETSEGKSPVEYYWTRTRGIVMWNDMLQQSEKRTW